MALLRFAQPKDTGGFALAGRSVDFFRLYMTRTLVFETHASRRERRRNDRQARRKLQGTRVLWLHTRIAGRCGPAENHLQLFDCAARIRISSWTNSFSRFFLRHAHQSRSSDSTITSKMMMLSWTVFPCSRVTPSARRASEYAEKGSLKFRVPWRSPALI